MLLLFPFRLGVITVKDSFPLSRQDLCTYLLLLRETSFNAEWYYPSPTKLLQEIHACGAELKRYTRRIITSLSSTCIRQSSSSPEASERFPPLPFQGCSAPNGTSNSVVLHLLAITEAPTPTTLYLSRQDFSLTTSHYASVYIYGAVNTSLL